LLLIEKIFADFSGKYRFSALFSIWIYPKNVKFCQLCLIGVWHDVEMEFHRRMLCDKIVLVIVRNRSTKLCLFEENIYWLRSIISNAKIATFLTLETPCPAKRTVSLVNNIAFYSKVRKTKSIVGYATIFDRCVLHVVCVSRFLHMRAHKSWNAFECTVHSMSFTLLKIECIL